MPQIRGISTLLDFNAYFKLIGDLKEKINPYTVTYMQTLGPPTVFFYFLPFSIFPIKAAQGIFTLINISCGISACYLLASRFYPKFKIAAFLLLNLIFFSSFPVRFSIEIGQPNLVICYLISLLICIPKIKFPSIILALLISIKTNYFLVLISFLKKNLKLVIKTLLVIISFAVLLFPIIKPSFYSYYLFQKTKNVLPAFGKNVSIDYYNQSIPSSLTRLGVIQNQKELYLLITIVLIYLTFRSSNLLVGILSSILLSPVAWQHYFAVLLPVFVVVFVNLKKKPINLLFFFIAIIFWWIEFPWLHLSPLNFINGVLASHYFISTLILIFLILLGSKKHSFMLK